MTKKNLIPTLFLQKNIIPVPPLTTEVEAEFIVGVILLGLHQFAMVKIIKLNKRVRNGHKKYQKAKKR